MCDVVDEKTMNGPVKERKQKLVELRSAATERRKTGAVCRPHLLLLLLLLRFAVDKRKEGQDPETCAVGGRLCSPPSAVVDFKALASPRTTEGVLLRRLSAPESVYHQKRVGRHTYIRGRVSFSFPPPVGKEEEEEEAYTTVKKGGDFQGGSCCC